MNEQLKPCPFCGGEAYLQTHYKFCISCIDCRADIPVKESEADAVAHWNRRVLDDAVNTILEQLRSNGL